MKKVFVIILLVSLLSGCNFSLLRGSDLAIIPITGKDITDSSGNFRQIKDGIAIPSENYAIINVKI